MSQIKVFKQGVWAAVALVLLAGCSRDAEPDLPWAPITLQEAGVEIAFPCDPQMARTEVDFGMGLGPVTVSMTGCDAIDSTYALSHWVLDDPKQANDALAFWQVAVLNRLKAVDGKDAKSGEPFVPAGALPLDRSIRAAVEGVGPSGWTMTTHGVWFARSEGEKVRIFHAVVYAPKVHHQTAGTFFQSIHLR